MVKDYQCWPDVDGKHAWLRHKCVDGYVKWMLPYLAQGWKWEGNAVVPSVVCEVPGCGFHMSVVRTNEVDPYPNEECKP
jgi:hypothetical protein